MRSPRSVATTLALAMLASCGARTETGTERADAGAEGPPAPGAAGSAGQASEAPGEGGAAGSPSGKACLPPRGEAVVTTRDVHDLVASDGELLWTENTDTASSCDEAGGAVRRMSLGPGQITALAEGGCRGVLAADESSVYSLETMGGPSSAAGTFSAKLLAAPRSGGPSVALDVPAANNLVLGRRLMDDGDGLLLALTSGGVLRVPKQAPGAAQLPFELPDQTSLVAVDVARATPTLAVVGAGVCGLPAPPLTSWGACTLHLSTWNRITKSLSPVATIEMGTQLTSVTVAASPTTICYVKRPEAVVTCIPLSGGPAVSLGEVFGLDERSLLVDEKHAYYVSDRSWCPRVMRAPLTGGEFKPFATGRGPLAIDGPYVYFTSDEVSPKKLSRLPR